MTGRRETGFIQSGASSVNQRISLVTIHSFVTIMTGTASGSGGGGEACAYASWLSHGPVSPSSSGLTPRTAACRLLHPQINVKFRPRHSSTAHTARVYMYVYLSIYVNVCTYVCLSVCLSVCMYVCMHTYIPAQHSTAAHRAVYSHSVLRDKHV